MRTNKKMTSSLYFFLLLAIFFLAMVFLQGCSDAKDMGVKNFDAYETQENLNADSAVGAGSSDVEGSPYDDEHSCDSDSDCVLYSSCVDGLCMCEEGYFVCGEECIPFDSCCSDNDCEKGLDCYDGSCVDLCKGVYCNQGEVCSGGNCLCDDGFKLCDDSCIPETGCCSDDDCQEGTACHDNKCLSPCEIVRCGPKETCDNGTCVCDKDYFRAKSGLCLTKGLCEVSSDCPDGKYCDSGFCMIDCYSKKEPVEISECFMEQAEKRKDPSKCSLVMKDKRDECYYRSAISSIDRSVCNNLQTDPPIDIYQYNQQNCVIEVAKAAKNPDLCEDTPSWTTLDPEDLDAYCRQKVENHIVDLEIRSIEDCKDDCSCRLRFAKRTDISSCSGVCSDDQAECVSSFYD